MKFGIQLYFPVLFSCLTGMFHCAGTGTGEERNTLNLRETYKETDAMYQAQLKYIRENDVEPWEVFERLNEMINFYYIHENYDQMRASCRAWIDYEKESTGKYDMETLISIRSFLLNILTELGYTGGPVQRENPLE